MSTTGNFFIECGGRRLENDTDVEAAGLRLNVLTDDYPGGCLYRVSVQNIASRPVAVTRVGRCLADPGPGLKTPDWRILLDRGKCGGMHVRRLSELGRFSRMEPVRAQRVSDNDPEPTPFHRSDLQTVLWDAHGGRAILIGFLRQRFGRNKVDVLLCPDGAGLGRIEAWQTFGPSLAPGIEMVQPLPVELAPGETQNLDPLVVAEGRDPYALLETYAEAVRAHHGRVFNEPPIVGMMTWYGLGSAIDETIILENARLVGALFEGYPQPMRKVMLLDHGWQEDANWGFWHADRRRFPHGMQWLAGQLAPLGLELGLWYTPFALTHNAPEREGLVSWLAVDKQGQPYSGKPSVWGYLPGHSSKPWTVHYFDGQLDEVQQKWQDELARMKAWGSVYFKLDFFQLVTSERNADHVRGGDLYMRTWENFRSAVGPAIHLAPCSCDTNVQIGYADSVHIGSDIGKAGGWPGAAGHYLGLMAPLAAMWYKQRKFWVNDPDSIQVGRAVPWGRRVSGPPWPRSAADTSWSARICAAWMRRGWTSCAACFRPVRAPRGRSICSKIPCRKVIPPCGN